VIKLGEVVMILDLHRQGLTVSAIARELGIDRKTVRKCITRGLEPSSLWSSQAAQRVIERFWQRGGSVKLYPARTLSRYSDHSAPT
jgi:transposase